MHHVPHWVYPASNRDHTLLRLIRTVAHTQGIAYGCMNIGVCDIFAAADFRQVL